MGKLQKTWACINVKAILPCSNRFLLLIIFLKESPIFSKDDPLRPPGTLQVYDEEMMVRFTSSPLGQVS